MYSIPINETKILIVDTNSNTYDLTSFSISSAGYYNCCYASNVNKIYAPPGNSSLSGSNVLIIDLDTNVCDTTSISITGNYESITYFPGNQKIYCAPFTLPLISGSIGIINTNGTTDTSSILLPAGSSSANYGFYLRGLVQSADTIYYLPGSPTMVISINPFTNIVNSSVLGIKFYQTNINL